MYKYHSQCFRKVVIVHIVNFLMCKPSRLMSLRQNGIEIENMGAGVRLPGLKLNTIVTNYIYLRMLVTLSLPQFPHAVKGFENCAYTKRIWED